MASPSFTHRYADIIDNEYVQTSKIPPFAMIGQRLYTGRVAVAQAALAYQRRLFQVTKKYSDNKQIVTPGGGGGTAPLSSIPQLRAIYAEADEASAELEAFVGECERQLSENLKSSTLPSPQLVYVPTILMTHPLFFFFGGGWGGLLEDPDGGPWIP